MNFSFATNPLPIKNSAVRVTAFFLPENPLAPQTFANLPQSPHPPADRQTPSKTSLRLCFLDLEKDLVLICK